MPIINFEGLDEGLNELANPQKIKGLQESVNYEMLGDGKLTKRRDPVEYGKDVDGDSLKKVLSDPTTGIFKQSILQIAPPYYPVKKLSDMTGDFILLVYGATALDGDNEPILALYMCYENDATPTSWTVTKVDITGIEYTKDTYLEFFIGDDKMIITDTYDETTNFPHYVKVDADGELITGLFSIKAPTNKPTLLPTTEYNAEEFEEDVDAVKLDDCGIVQCVYTVITKEGDESNPSPISNSRMMQFFKKDTTDFNDERWLDYFNITNLSVPVLTGDLTEQLKYFNVYFRVIRYSEGEAAEPFYFSQRFDIIDKVSNQGNTGNGYLITVPQDTSILLSYENDIAPYAKHAAEVSSITGFANIREKTRFPFDFEKYVPLEINNVNNKNFVDAIVQIRLYDKNNTDTLDHDNVQVDFIDDLELDYYDSAGKGVMQNLNLIRIYDDDKITPIKVAYEVYNGGWYIDVFVKIPLLVAGQIKYLYLCFNTEDSEELGVTTEEYQTAEYGEFTVLDADNVSDMFDTERVKSNRTVICSPFDYQDKSDEIINLADDNNPGEILGDEGEFDSNEGTKQLDTQNAIGSGSYLLKGESGNGDDFSEIRFSEMGFSEVPQKFLIYFRMKYSTLPQGSEKIIFAFDSDSREKAFAFGAEYFEGEYRWKIGVYYFTDLVNDRGSMPFTEIPTTDDGEVFIAISVDRDEKASLFVGNLETGSFYRQELLWDDTLVYMDSEHESGSKYFEEFDSFSIGRNDYPSGHYPGNFQFKISQFQLTINKYYSAKNHNDVTAIYNIASFMPSFEMAIGTKLRVKDEEAE